MCGRSTREFTWAEIHDLLSGVCGEVVAPEPGVEGLGASWNLAPTQAHVAVRRREEGGGLTGGVLRWGLIPGWARDASIQSKLINARGETVDQKPSFRDAFAHRRCVVPMSSFYEWDQVGGASGGGKGKKQPYRVVRADGQPMLMAGLWERNDVVGEAPTETFTVITTEANGFMVGMHPRMPVILEPEHVSMWLSPATGHAAAKALLRASAEGVLDAYRVDPRVGNVRQNDPDLIGRYEPPAGGSEGSRAGGQGMLF